MLMSPSQIMQAYRAIQELSTCVFPYKVTRNLHKLRRRINEEFDTVLVAEQAMVKQYGGTYSDGTYNFTDMVKAKAFHEAYSKWLDQQDDLDLPVVDLSKYPDAIQISEAAIDALECVINFEEV